MARFLARALLFGFFWFVFFSMKIAPDKTIFKKIHETNDDMINAIDTWLGGRPAPKDVP